MHRAALPDGPPAPASWAKVIDHDRCIGCHACTTACKSENDVPLSVTRTYVKYVDVGLFPDVRRAFQVTRCNQCEHAPCVTACPTAAMFARSDGIVDFDKAACIGCKACIAACPYDAIFINPEDHSAEKCNLCAHRLDIGLEPACVVVCPTQAILVGDAADPESGVGSALAGEGFSVRRPEKGTRPKVFYQGALQATLDPLAATRPPGGLFMWSEQGDLPHQVPSGQAGTGVSSAAAVLAYDVPHRAPWDWRVSLYTWTKSISAGAYLVALTLVLFGGYPTEGALWRSAAPLICLTFLGLTGLLLVWDLEHPARFYYLFTRPQWDSWLVRGGVVITLYGAVLGGHAAATLLGHDLELRLALLGAPAALMTAIYTAFLFRQARARELWHGPLLVWHLTVQAVYAGSGALLAWAVLEGDPAVAPLTWLFAAAGLGHLAIVEADGRLIHAHAHASGLASVHARAAHLEMTRGRYAGFHRAGIVLVLAGLAAPWLPLPAALLGLAGLLAHEHAFVQAGQSVALA